MFRQDHAEGEALANRIVSNLAHDPDEMARRIRTMMTRGYTATVFTAMLARLVHLAREKQSPDGRADRRERQDQ